MFIFMQEITNKIIAGNVSIKATEVAIRANVMMIKDCTIMVSTVTSQCSRMIFQPFVRAQTKEALCKIIAFNEYICKILNPKVRIEKMINEIM